jgi:hypothetical protein
VARMHITMTRIFSLIRAVSIQLSPPFAKNAVPEKLRLKRDVILYHNHDNACQEKNDIW